MDDTTNNAQKPENGGSERLFTQEEVNRIVADRLARERSKGAKSVDDLTARENDLKAREEALNARLAKETLSHKTTAFKSILKEIGVYEKRIDSITEDSKKAEAFIDAMELDESGEVKDRAAQLEKAKTVFAGNIIKTTTEGAKVDNPPTWLFQGVDKDAELKRAFGLK